MTTLTRRRLLALLPFAAAEMHAQSSLKSTIFRRRQKAQASAASPLVYFGTDTDKPGARGIYASRFDVAHGQFSPPVLAAESLKPTYLALNQVHGRRVLYAINAGDAKTSGVTTYLIEPGTGALQRLGQVPSAGADPCYISVDATGQFAYVANYNGGTVTSFKVQPDGTLSQPLESINFHSRAFGKHGPQPDRQDGPHPHSAQLSPDNRFLIVNDLGNDDIVAFPIHPDTGLLGTPTIAENRVPGSGPRHLAFHPNGRWAYGIDELSNRVDQYLWNTTHGVGGALPQGFLTDAGHPVRTTEATFRGLDTAAEVAVSPNGYYLYASNRGENSLAVFGIDQSTGALSFVQRIACGGKGPRHFTLDPTGNWLVCGNQDSASVTVFARNAGTGRLSGPVQTLPLPGPVFTLFL